MKTISHRKFSAIWGRSYETKTYKPNVNTGRVMNLWNAKLSILIRKQIYIHEAMKKIQFITRCRFSSGKIYLHSKLLNTHRILIIRSVSSPEFRMFHWETLKRVVCWVFLCHHRKKSWQGVPFLTVYWKYLHTQWLRTLSARRGKNSFRTYILQRIICFYVKNRLYIFCRYHWICRYKHQL